MRKRCGGTGCKRWADVDLTMTVGTLERIASDPMCKGHANAVVELAMEHRNVNHPITVSMVIA